MTDSFASQANASSQFVPGGLLISVRQMWTGRILSGFAAAFLIFDGGAKVFKVAPVVEAMTRLGYPESAVAGIGGLLLLCTMLYLIPTTAVVGAILLTGYLGGAVATNLRVSGPVFPIVFPVLLGMIVWLGLLLRDARVRGFLM